MKKYLAMLGIASMLSAGAVVAGATAASAQAPSGSASCDGVVASATDYDNKDTNTYTISLDAVVQKSGTFNKKFDDEVSVPTDGISHTWEVSITSSGDPNGSKGWTKVFSGDVGPCDAPAPGGGNGNQNGNGNVQISFCHWTNGGHYNYLTTSVMAFYNRGHIDHHDHKDIYPAGSANGQSWPAQGTADQLALLAAGSCPPPPPGARHIVVAAPSATAPTCDVAGRLVIPLTEHVTWKGGADGDGPGTYRLRAKADAGYVVDGQRKWTITVEPQLTGAQCGAAPQSVTPLAPNWVDPCDANNGHWVFTPTAEYDYTVTTNNDGSSTIVAVAKQGYQFAAGATTQWTEKDSGSLCPIELLVPATPGVTDLCGIGNATWKVPGNGNNVTWDLRGNGDLVASTDVGYTFPRGQTTHNFGQAPETNTAACPVVLASVGVAAPVLTPPTCTAPGKLSYTDAVGYTWNRTEDHGNVVLTAIAKPGFTLVGTTSWTYTAAQLARLSGATACPPAVIPPEVEGVKHTAPPKPPAVKGVKHEAAATLPRTGSESGLYGAAGLLLLMVGSGLVLATRQRSTEGRAH